MKTEHKELIAVLHDTRALLGRPENNFDWSSWGNVDAAFREIDALIGKIEAGEMPRRGDIEKLYVPTGPVQEVSLSSGWDDEFLAVADRFDAVIVHF